MANNQDFSYYRALIDQDRQEDQLYNRDLKDQAVKILEETGYQNPNDLLNDQQTSPFEEYIDINEPYMRAKERIDIQKMPERMDETIPPIQDINRNPSSVENAMLPAGKKVQSEDAFLPNGTYVQSVPAQQYKPGPIESAVSDIIAPKRPEIPLQSHPDAQGLSPQAQVPTLTPQPQSVQRSASIKVSVPPTGSTAPQQLSEEELAADSRDFNNVLNENLRGTEAYYDLSRQAKEGLAAAEKESQMMTADVSKNQLLGIQDQLEKQRQINALARAEADKASKEIASQIDPGRVWKNKSTWSKISLVLGAALQGYAGSDAGLRTIDNIITRDLQAQIDDRNKGIKKHGDLLDFLSAGTKNEAEILKNGRELGMKIVDAYKAALAAGAKQDAAKYAALADTMKNYFQPVVEAKIKSQASMQNVSSQEQKRRDDDIKNSLAAQELKIKAIEQKTKASNLGAEEANRFEATANMAQAADEMEKMENKQDFNPTSAMYAVSQYLDGKGVPGSLSKSEAQYLAAYMRYFSYLRRGLTGAAASDSEEQRIRKLVAPGATITRDALKNYQRMRYDAININVNALNDEGKLRLMNIPEARRFMVNRGAVEDSKSLRGK